MTELETVFDRHEGLARLLAEPLPARRQAARKPVSDDAVTEQKAERPAAGSAAIDRQMLLPRTYGTEVQPPAEKRTEAAALFAGEKLFSPGRNELAQTLSRAFERDARRY